MLMQRRLPLPERAVPKEITLRPQEQGDVAGLGALYWDSYPDGAAAVDLEDATEEMEAVFEGDYGTPVAAASLVATDAEGRLLGCVQTVTDAPWEGVPQGPFVIELFVHPDHRRRGLGSLLLTSAANACAGQGWDEIALNVQDETAEEAIHLYRQLGFEKLAAEPAQESVSP